MMHGMNYIDGQWRTGSGPRLQSLDPYSSELLWEGQGSDRQDVHAAVAAARAAFPSWAAQPLTERQAILREYEAALQVARPGLSECISQEVGKPLWESQIEVATMINKIGISIQAMEERCGIRSTLVGDSQNVVRYKPHGVVSVFGPFNFPGHLPGGHIVPALLAGNTVVFKPSEWTPAVGQMMAELWDRCDFPPGVVNVIQGDRETGIALASHPELDGLFFTGSSSGGRAIHECYGGHPDKILALEMGGNNPLIVHDVEHLEAAAYWAIQSSFLTSGQRCACARRLIVTDAADPPSFQDRLLAGMARLRVGGYRAQPEPFLGPVISASAADRILAQQDRLRTLGAEMIRPMERLPASRALLSPGLIDVTPIANRPDEEIFGPLIQWIRVPDLDAAIHEANRTAFGLTSALFSRDRHDFEKFLQQSRAGIVNWNKPTTGASSAAPFGGIGQSGNHRPSGYFAADYCAYPVASMECDQLTMPATTTPGIDGGSHNDG